MTARLVAAVGMLCALVACGTTPTAAAPAAPADSTQRAAPTHIDIPTIGARSDLIPLGLGADGALQVPPVDQPGQASWWDGSGHPGVPGRPVVVLGHVDGGGRPGVFARIDELKPGDPVLVDGVHRFRVYAVEAHSKDAFPTARVYGDTDTPELRLITCGGSFDRATGHYRDNIIVHARLEDR